MTCFETSTNFQQPKAKIKKEKFPFKSTSDNQRLIEKLKIGEQNIESIRKICTSEALYYKEQDDPNEEEYERLINEIKQVLMVAKQFDTSVK